MTNMQAQPETSATEKRPELALHLVVIGSSAGGIEALSALLARVPVDFPAPILIAQHLDPSRPSQLQEILARHKPTPRPPGPHHLLGVDSTR